MGNLIVYVGFAQADEWPHWAGTYARHTQRFEAASGEPCLVIPYTLATPELMARLAPRAVVLSGFARSFQDYAVASLHAVANWIVGAEMPVLAICGSHQLLGFIFNSPGNSLGEVTQLHDQPMRHLRPGEPITNPDYHSEYYMERGFYTLTLTDDGRSDPLFAGLRPTPVVCESHYCEIKTLPAEFELLASTPECKIQAIRHRSRPLYGVQFHPEDYIEGDDRLADGKTILENFFKMSA